MLNNNIHKTAQFVSDTLMNIPRDMIASLRSPYLAVRPLEVAPESSERDDWSQYFGQGELDHSFPIRF